jgi:HK97 family phage portal protein
VGKLLDTFLGKYLRKNEQPSLNFIDIFRPSFFGSSDPRLNDTFMTCVQAHGRHAAKFCPRAIKNGEENDKAKHITYLLSQRPNPLMSAPVFWETITEDYFTSNNAFIFLEWDYSNYKEPLKALWRLDPDMNQMEIRTNENNEVFLRFNLNGKTFTTSINDVAIIPRNIDATDIFGGNNKAVADILKMIRTNYQGIEQAIKMSAFLRFLVQTTTPLTQPKREEKAKEFAEAFLEIEKSTGVAYIDSAQQIIQVNSQAKYLDAPTVKFFESKIYNYLGINEAIVSAKFTEDEWQAYYESSLEPLALKIASELTYKIFSLAEIRQGNAIEIYTDALQTASLKTRATIAALIMKLPTYRPNDINDLLYMPRTINGDKEYSTLNYVEADKANQYQGVEDNTDGKENNDAEGNP